MIILWQCVVNGNVGAVGNIEVGVSIEVGGSD